MQLCRRISFLAGADDNPLCRLSRMGPEGEDLQAAKPPPVRQQGNHLVHPVRAVDQGKAAAVFQLFVRVPDPVGKRGPRRALAMGHRLDPVGRGGAAVLIGGVHHGGVKAVILHMPVGQDAAAEKAAPVRHAVQRGVLQGKVHQFPLDVDAGQGDALFPRHDAEPRRAHAAADIQQLLPLPDLRRRREENGIKGGVKALFWLQKPHAAAQKGGFDDGNIAHGPLLKRDGL